MTATAPPFGTIRAAGATPLARLLLITTVLLGTVFTVLSGTASAHAALTGSTPEDGAVVATAPQDITLTFSEQVAMGDDSIRVLDPDSKRVDDKKIRDLSSGSTIRYGIGLNSGLGKGTYTVSWRAVSVDSHPIAGAFTFSIGAPSKTTAVATVPKAGGGLVGVLYDIGRYISYTGFILLVGGIVFILACWQRGASVRPLQRLVVAGWLALTSATLALLLLRTPYTSTGKLGDAFDLGGLQDVLTTKTGAALISRLLLLGAAGLFIAVLFGAYTRRGAEEAESRGEVRKDLTFGLAMGGTVVAAGIAGTWALSEHASAGIQAELAMPVDVLHLLAVAAWLGGLTALLIALYWAPFIESTAVRRFSRIAFVSVVVIAATGLYQSWRQVGSWSALGGTSYGRLLLVKIGLVAGMVVIAWFSRRWTGRLGEAPAPEAPATGDETDESGGSDDGPGDGGSERATQLSRQKAALATARQKRVRDADPGRTGLRRSVLAEAGIAVVLLGVTTVLTSTEPGRTAEQEAGRSGSAAVTDPATREPLNLSLPFDTGGKNGKGTARLTFGPAAPGANVMDIKIVGPDGKPLDVPEVKIAFTLKPKQIGPLPVTPERTGAGQWKADPVLLPMPGDWQLQVTVRTSDIDQTTVDKNVKIG
ncbi:MULTISPECIES: copper resistance protein CopC [unclassified Streptomyces]|uniref:copper resistance protein CopC n=1 Tax=unclassified Streptomyces TaxID=2593676 RepID=UPI0037FB1CDA